MFFNHNKKYLQLSPPPLFESTFKIISIIFNCLYVVIIIAFIPVLLLFAVLFIIHLAIIYISIITVK